MSNPSYMIRVETLERVVADMRRRGVKSFYVKEQPSGAGETMRVFSDGVPSVVFVSDKGVYGLICDLTGSGDRASVILTEAL